MQNYSYIHFHLYRQSTSIYCAVEQAIASNKDSFAITDTRLTLMFANGFNDRNGDHCRVECLRGWWEPSITDEKNLNNELEKLFSN